MGANHAREKSMITLKSSETQLTRVTFLVGAKSLILPFY